MDLIFWMFPLQYNFFIHASFVIFLECEQLKGNERFLPVAERLLFPFQWNPGKAIASRRSLLRFTPVLSHSGTTISWGINCLSVSTTREDDVCQILNWIHVSSESLILYEWLLIWMCDWCIMKCHWKVWRTPSSCLTAKPFKRPPLERSVPLLIFTL